MRPTLTALPLALLLAACGGGGDDLQSAYELLEEGRYGEARTILETQLATLEKGTPEYKEATIGLCEALAESEPEEAKSRFLAFAEESADTIEPKDFKYVVSHLETHEHYDAAIDVMHTGATKWPEDETMVQIKDALVATVKNSGNAAANAKLKGLGYL